MIRHTRLAAALTLAFLFTALPAFAQEPPQELDGAELLLALEQLTVVGSALYVGAHPDDENTALLSWLSKGKKVRTGYLAITRGDGGQNLIGTERGAAMGVLRTQELLGARRVDGAEQYFTRAIDFGYTKSPEETLRLWGHDEILADVVRVIRRFRPDVIITRFPGDGSGRHGQHTASTLLAKEAFVAAADPSRFSEQLDTLQPWQAKHLLWNDWRSSDQVDGPRLSIDLGAFSPLLGRSFTQIAATSRSMHKSQGFGASARRGSHLNYFLPLAGEPPRDDLFEGIDLTWSRIPGGEAVGRLLAQAVEHFDPQRPSAVVPDLLAAHHALQELPADDPWVAFKRQQLERVLRAASGVWLDATAATASAPPGGDVRVTATALSRSPVVWKVVSVGFPGAVEAQTVSAPLDLNQPFFLDATVRIPSDQAPTRNYWLAEPPDGARYRVSDPSLIGLPEAPAPLQVRFVLQVDGETQTVEVPVVYRWTDPVEGERWRRFEVLPPVTLEPGHEVFLFPGDSPREVRVTVRAGASDVQGAVRLALPEGWRAGSEDEPFSLQGEGREEGRVFTVTPPTAASVGTLQTRADVGGDAWGLARQRVDYPHIPPQTLLHPATARLVRLELERRGERIGYVMGAGDEVPDVLRQLGYQVVLLSDEDLRTGDLHGYDAIVTGVRAYNTRKTLAAANRRLLDYVAAGGTLVVQYDTTRGLLLDDFGPYPLELSHDRVTVEDAPVTFLDPRHPLLTTPNRITAADFDGWIQERGLYFADHWDGRYQPVIASHDPGEQNLAGGLLYTPWGKGIWIYTGYAFFRQLPAGVPGAIRLFTNLVSARGPGT
jgi:LmbE family N-acetylglucosaminyl deacetylase